MSYVFTLQNGKRQTKVVAGLRWFPLVPDNFKKDLLPLAADMAADMYVYRKSNKSVVGLGKLDDGVGKGMAALGLFISRYLEEIAADIYALVAVAIPGHDDLYAYIMVRDGFIMPEGDHVGTREEIEAKFRETASSGDWERQYCPADWNVPKSEELSLDDIIQVDKKGRFTVPKSWLIKPVKPSLPAQFLKGAAIVALVLAPIQGYQILKADQAKKQAEVVAAQAAAAEEQARQERLMAEPWKRLVQPSDFAKACNEAIQAVGLIAATWAVHEFACAGETYTIKWERTSTETWVKHMRALHPSAKISQDGSFATLVTKLRLPQADKQAPEKLEAFEGQVDRLRDLPNEQPIAVNLRFPPVPPVPVGVQAEAMPWSEVNVTATTELGPESAASSLASPGYRITKITGSFKSGVVKYEIEGIQYGKN